MTNGEKIQQIFPNRNYESVRKLSGINRYEITSSELYYPLCFSEDWWNAEYKEPTTRNCFGCKYSKDNHNAGTEECHLCMWENQYTPTTKNDLGVDCIDRAELLKAMDTWDKFGYTTRYGLERLDKDDKGFVPYVKYDDMVNCVKNMPSVTSQLSSELEKNSQKLEKDFGELDCISRTDARKAIIDHQYSDSFCEEHSIDHSINTGMALIALSDLPSVTPQEPKTGHWEYGYAFADGNYCKCSECKEIIKCIYPMHYCPNYGAKMIEPQESEDKE